MSKFFISRPIVAIVISIITVIAGLVAMTKLPVAQLPDIVPPQINVAATYTGADALTIEQSVATPLEQQMNGVDNMLYMMSTNANDGTMTLKVTYDVGTNVDIDQVNTQNRVSQASPNLPTSVNQYGVTVKKPRNRYFSTHWEWKDRAVYFAFEGGDNNGRWRAMDIDDQFSCVVRVRSWS